MAAHQESSNPPRRMMLAMQLAMWCAVCPNYATLHHAARLLTDLVFNNDATRRAFYRELQPDHGGGPWLQDVAAGAALEFEAAPQRVQIC